MRMVRTLTQHVAIPLRRTSAARLPLVSFLTGDTPEGLVDMSGNTWDWTGSLYQPYPYNAGDGREDPVPYAARRVVRGGSWRGVRGLARASCRYDLHPDDRYSLLGLRVARSSPSLA